MRFGASSIGFIANQREEEERVRDKNDLNASDKKKGKRNVRKRNVKFARYNEVDR